MKAAVNGIQASGGSGEDKRISESEKIPIEDLGEGHLFGVAGQKRRGIIDRCITGKCKSAGLGERGWAVHRRSR